MNFWVGQNDSRFGDIFDRVFCSAAFSRQPADAPGQVIALQGLDVFDVERVQVEVVEPEQRQRIVDLESEDESANEIGRLLQVGNVLRLFARLDFNVPRFQVESEKIKYSKKSKN